MESQGLFGGFLASSKVEFGFGAGHLWRGGFAIGGLGGLGFAGMVFGLSNKIVQFDSFLRKIGKSGKNLKMYVILRVIISEERICRRLSQQR